MDGQDQHPHQHEQQLDQEPDTTSRMRFTVALNRAAFNFNRKFDYPEDSQEINAKAQQEYTFAVTDQTPPPLLNETCLDIQAMGKQRVGQIHASGNILSPKPSTLEQIAHQFLHPPISAFDREGLLSMAWVIRIAGKEHFTTREDGRLILNGDSNLRKYGKQLGIPAAMQEWLCGDDQEQSEREAGIMLTVEFFENEV